MRLATFVLVMAAALAGFGFLVTMDDAAKIESSVESGRAKHQAETRAASERVPPSPMPRAEPYTPTAQTRSTVPELSVTLPPPPTLSRATELIESIGLTPSKERKVLWILYDARKNMAMEFNTNTDAIYDGQKVMVLDVHRVNEEVDAELSKVLTPAELVEVMTKIGSPSLLIGSTITPAKGASE